MKKGFSIIGSAVLLLALLTPSSAYAATDCTFKSSDKAMKLIADCTTDATIVIPDGYTLNGNGHSITAVDPPGDHFKGAVVRNGGATANIRNLTITVSGLADVCDDIPDRLTGILFLGASGNIRNNKVLNINQGASSCEEGIGIDVDNPLDNPNIVRVMIEDNVVSAYQLSGIVANNTVYALVRDNTVTGLGPVDTIAQNGIQLGFGATGRVVNNTVSGNVFTPQTVVGAGILLFSAGDGIRVDRNELDNNDVGIWLSGANLAGIHANKVTVSNFDGITLDDVGGSVQNNKLERNEMSDNLSGIALFGAGVMNNMIRNNEAHDNGDGFFIGFSATLNTLQNNEALNNVFDGILINADSNAIRRNEASGNGDLDIENLGTDNTYISNECETSSGPPVDCPETDQNEDLSSASTKLMAEALTRPAPSPVK
jgi:parallel beta-helix repeat protein